MVFAANHLVSRVITFIDNFRREFQRHGRHLFFPALPVDLIDHNTDQPGFQTLATAQGRQIFPDFNQRLLQRVFGQPAVFGHQQSGAEHHFPVIFHQ